jgi:hypothetical protein
MHWQPGIPPGNTADSYEIYDVLCAPDGRIVAILECFTHSPTVYYCNALTPTGEWRRLGGGSNYDTTRDWAERVTEGRSRFEWSPQKARAPSGVGSRRFPPPWTVEEPSGAASLSATTTGKR